MRERDSKNRLGGESSPYLLQHSRNPVNWYPWTEEPFREAAEKDKPVFLSIGYSTCHWCHVMEEESFEDAEVARLMNRAFVSIKVDREERPDIDDIYMTVCQIMTGSGGWPLNVIMTPERKPFYAATYIPREDRFGRIGMLTLVPRIEQMWQNRRKELAASAERIVGLLKNNEMGGGGGTPGRNLIDEAYRGIEESYDPEYGGFGTAPKFPSAHKLQFLLRYWKRTGNPHAMEMVQKTLLAMRRGGIFDQLGFGFHRYSTDRGWILPHFEKMLYDQAAMAKAYTECFLATGDPVYRNIAEEVFTYILRDLRSPEGAFYSAEDADSEGGEGRFYIWSIDQAREVLDRREVELAAAAFNLEEGGNFREQGSGRKGGGNVLHVAESAEDLAAQFNIDREEAEKLIESIRVRMLSARSKRVRPGLDDKILADWNGMAISALARAGAAFGRDEYITAAAGTADFIIERMQGKDRRLLHRFRGGEAGIPGFIDDYAFVISGFIDLYQAGFMLKYLTRALDYMEAALELFWDDSAGGFFTSSGLEDELIIRQKKLYDGAVPCGNSEMLMNLLRLGRLTGRGEFEQRASDLQSVFAERIASYPLSYTGFLSGMDSAIGPSVEVVVTGNRDREQTGKMIRELHRYFCPDLTVLFKPFAMEQGDEDAGELDRIAPFTRGIPADQGKPAAYICRDFSCQRPVYEPAAIIDLLDCRRWKE